MTGGGGGGVCPWKCGLPRQVGGARALLVHHDQLHRSRELAALVDVFVVTQQTFAA